ncbi:MAG: 23S rRNA (guanosine(2251)-2'-O)-methyltransferase RlmB, partial [Ilumatobacteraceae bacterium]
GGTARRGRPASADARSDRGRGAPDRGPRRGAAPAAGAPASPRGSARPEKSLGGDQVEGRQAVRELLVAGSRKVREIWVSSDPDRNEVIGDIIDIARSMRIQVTDVARARLDRQARSEAPQGVIAFAAPLEETDLDQLMRRRTGSRSGQPFLVALDGVTDPGNLGALLRCCDGAGVTGVILPRHRAVHVTPTVAKAAAGAIEHIPMAVVGGLPAALARLTQAGIWVVGLDDDADRSLFELGDLAAEGICLVLGAEGAGLSRLARERCDLVVSIPMRGRLSSLNVSAAGALAVYEVARHRSG